MKKPATLIREALRPFFHKPAPVLEVDKKLQLREVAVEDIDRMYKLIDRNRDHLKPWLSWIEKINTLEDCRDFVNKLSYRNIFSGRWVYGIWWEDEHLIGMVDFNEGDRNLNQVSIGYWLSEAYQGKGIVTRTVRRCLDYVFDVQHLHKVVIKCASDNFRSQAIPIRLRFTWEGLQTYAGTVNGRSVDLVAYSMVYQDWARIRTLEEKEAKKEKQKQPTNPSDLVQEGGRGEKGEVRSET